ncbi:MAG: hypothetical protein JXR27_04985 [Paludibacteraceae bacterium]|nr:hypothetical protein [Paludibacteraceae bacterium]
MYLTEKLLAFLVAIFLFLISLSSCVDPVDSTDINQVSIVDYNRRVLGNYNYKVDQNYSYAVSIDIDDDMTDDLQISFQNKYGRFVGVESYINIKPLNGTFLLMSEQYDSTFFSGLKFDAEWEFSREFRDFFTQDSIVFYPGFSKGDTTSVKMKLIESTVMLRWQQV